MSTQFIEELEMEPKTQFQKWMLDRGIKQSWLAEHSGLKQPLISKFATGKTLPDVHQAQKIVNAFRTITTDVSIEVLWPLPEEDE